MKNITFITLFTTGRTGTAFLTEAFSGQKWEKRNIYVRKNCLVTHESIPTEKLRIPELKKLDWFSNESIKIQKQVIENLLNELQKCNANKIFITDHRIGRFYSPFLIKKLNSKIIYIERDEQQTLDSFMKRLNLRKKILIESQYKKYIQRRWNNNLYEPTDLSTICKMNRSDWKDLSEEEQIRWYLKETKERWKILKEKTNLNCIEISFDDIKNHNLTKISDFIEIEYDKNISYEKIN